MIIQSKAIVIKSFPYGDSSLISRVLIENGQKLSIMIKGAKSLKSNKTALFQSLNLIQMNYYHKDNRDMQILKNVSLHNSLNMVRSNLSKIILRQIIIESLDKTTPDNNPQPVLYKLTWRVLNKIDEKNVYHWMVFSFFYIIWQLDWALCPI